MVWVKKISVWFMFVMLIAKPATAGTAEDACRKSYMENPPEVNVVYNYGQLKFDNSKTVAELREMYKIVNSGKSSQNIRGLTDLEPSVTTGVTATVIMLDENTYCFYPQKIMIKAWYNPTIFIANVLEPGTCRFNTTVRHEQTHLDLAHHALYVFAKTLRNAVPDILSSVDPIVADASFDGDKISREMTDAYHKKVKVYFDKFKEDTEKYNGIIDSPENYIFETGLCTGR